RARSSMVRLACISLPKIDLQIVALRHPEWKALPAAVITEEKPLGRITAANRAAYASGVQPGMRYAAALSICPELRAGVVTPEEREALRQRLVSLLRGFSPQIEPAAHDPALFWINAGGLGRIYGTTEAWAGAVEREIEASGLVCSIAVGFSRFGTYAAAKVKRRVTIFERAEDEEQAALDAPVGIFPIHADVLLRFHQLGIRTVRDFRRFSPGSIRRRFGSEVEELQRFARGDDRLPVQAVEEPDLLRREMRLLYPEASVEALVHHQLSLLRELAGTAWASQQLVSELVLEFCPESWPGAQEECHREEIVTSKPTLDQRRLERLVRLRLEGIRLSGPVVRLSLEARLLPMERAQDDLFESPSKRDPRKALDAIAELCAELGNDAVQVASLENAHLPEEQYEWRRVERLPLPRPAGDRGAVRGPAALVRRILHEPLPLSRLPEEYHHPRIRGPYELSGGWWQSAYRREYYYLQDASGRLLWVYYDAPRKQWLVQGVVE
ncbi:MAG: hypothetical protein ACOC1U_11205, partial [Spirochaetota bacterium]